MQKKAEERWGSGVVEQVALDLQQEFPTAKGFSERNLWYMKKWFLFYSNEETDTKLTQLTAELQTPIKQQFTKLQQPVAEFPQVLALVPWGHHIEIITHCDSIDEAIFYLRYSIANGLSRNVLSRVIPTISPISSYVFPSR